MTGSVIIKHTVGWACSNDVSMIVERDIIKKDDGSPISRHTNTLRINSLFDAKGILQKDDKVDCVFKLADTGTLQAFTARVIAITKEMCILHLLTTSTREKEIINKIKEEISYGS